MKEVLFLREIGLKRKNEKLENRLNLQMYLVYPLTIPHFAAVRTQINVTHACLTFRLYSEKENEKL